LMYLLNGTIILLLDNQIYLCYTDLHERKNKTNSRKFKEYYTKRA